MKGKSVFAIVLSLAVVQLAAAVSLTGRRQLATVTVQELRSTRSAENSHPVYQVRIQGPVDDLRVNLKKPSYSVFTPSFKYIELATDSDGELQYTDATPTVQELHEIEKHFFTDPESNAALSVKQVNGAYQVRGQVEDLSLVARDDNLHEISRKPKQDPKISDYVDLKRVVPPGKSSRATSVATPEVFVVWDYDNTQTFKASRTAILDYLGVFFHAINNRYATASDPQISFRISSVTAITSRSAQPYMENNKTPSGTGYDISNVLTDFSKWLYTNSTKTSAPKYDLGALITGTDMQMKDSNGNYQTNVAGLAYLKGACWNYTSGQQYLGASVTEDIGGYYDGLFSVAHEFAHNLGAPHDGDGDASSCSWEDGYLMSYKGWGTKNKFYFSSCSLSLMKGLIDSTAGKCTKSQESSTTIPLSSQNVGDRFSMQQLCVKYTKQANATVNPGDPNDLCKNLVCRYPTPNQPGYISIITLNHPPGDNSACGNGGKCVNGDCVVGARG